MKIEMREKFVKGMVEALNLPENDYPSMKDIESVLIMNRLPARGCENRNLYKFFGKGKSIRAPSKELSNQTL